MKDSVVDTAEAGNARNSAYVSEGLRGALTPSLPHMSMTAVLAALSLMTVGFGVIGLRPFERRALG